jgi:hypothetical protein
LLARRGGHFNGDGVQDETLELTDYAAMILPFVAAVWSAWNTYDAQDRGDPT